MGHGTLLFLGSKHTGNILHYNSNSKIWMHINQYNYIKTGTIISWHISNSTTTKQNCGPSVIDWSGKSDGI